MLKSSLCDYTDAYILGSGTITITGEEDNDAAKRLDEINKGVIFKYFAPFNDRISEINNTQIDNAKVLEAAMPMYNLIEYSDNYSKTSGSFWQCYRDDPNKIITDFESFKFKVKITGKTPAACNTKDVRIAVPLKHLSNFWRTLEVPLINCATYLILTWSENFVISSATGETEFKIKNVPVYVPVVTLSTQDNANLLQQLKSGFKKTINWNKYQSKVSQERQNQDLDFLISPSFQGVNRLFVLSFENGDGRKVRTRYYLPKVEIKNYNVMIGGKTFLISQSKVI